MFALVAPPGEYGNALTTDMVLRLEMEETGAGDDASPPTERRCGGRASDGLGVPVVTPPSAPTVPSLKRGRGDRCCDFRRCTTLGGAGKTALALAVAWAPAPVFVDRVGRRVAPSALLASWLAAEVAAVPVPCVAVLAAIDEDDDDDTGTDNDSDPV